MLDDHDPGWGAYMAHVRKTTEELIAEEEKKSDQVKARMAELKARQRIEERKRDTHRKVVSGAILIAQVKRDPRFRRAVQDTFNKAEIHPKHRAVIADLLDEEAFQQAMRAAKKAAVEAREAAESEKQLAPATRPQQQGESGRETRVPVPP